MNEIYVAVSGNVVGEPVVRVTRANVPFVTFRVASNVRRLDFKTGDYIDAGTNFVNVTAFRMLGVNVSNSVKKGEPVIVYGRMRINQWVNAERSGTTVEIDAYNVGHDLSWGQTTFNKVARPQLNQHDRMADPEVQEAADQLDRDAETVDDELLGTGGELLAEGLAQMAGGSGELASTDTETYETVGAGSHEVHPALTSATAGDGDGEELLVCCVENSGD